MIEVRTPVARRLCNIAADLRQENQLPGHPFSSRTLVQNCSSESAMDASRCLACHNKTTTKAKLILETPLDILKGGESGKVVVPKRSGESLLLKIASHQVKPMMPPKNNKVQESDLTPEELLPPN